MVNVYNLLESRKVLDRSITLCKQYTPSDRRRRSTTRICSASSSISSLPIIPSPAPFPPDILYLVLWFARLNPYLDDYHITTAPLNISYRLCSQVWASVQHACQRDTRASGQSAVGRQNHHRAAVGLALVGSSSAPDAQTSRCHDHQNHCSHPWEQGFVWANPPLIPMQNVVFALSVALNNFFLFCCRRSNHRIPVKWPRVWVAAESRQSGLVGWKH